MSRSSVPSKRSTDEREAAWVADEDRFVLQQEKIKAAIRVKGNRAQPVDWLAVALAILYPERNPLEGELDDVELDKLKDPEAVFDGCDAAQLSDLEKSITSLLALETSMQNQDFWMLMKTICQDRIKASEGSETAPRGVHHVQESMHKILSGKDLAGLEKLEGQIHTKLSSGKPVDTDYWDHVLKLLQTYKAKAKLRKISHQLSDARARNKSVRKFKADAVSHSSPEGQPEQKQIAVAGASHAAISKQSSQLSTQDNRKRPASEEEPPMKRSRVEAQIAPSNPAFDRAASRGLGENEELFNEEVEVVTKNRAQWSGQHRPRKPKYFNSVLLGYEWNKYNQTHYDQDNPPPKVVQGYKFNIFYPDLADVMKTPTFKIEREDGRKRGQSFAPAGEDDTCVIRFVAGAPYEDVAFRIVDKEWDYSAKRERGYLSEFRNGTLQLHFQYKKIYYRK